MAEISLRDYVKEIDNLIENGRQIDQAIEHCRQILKDFPRHVDTYRLLGKAFLEKKQYADSADIFTRVLSAIPDDFVSHIGMAIAREDENNVDDAIWHMERAFEANPANSAIQHELRRLILKRDGLEPQKIRLTRAALARVYAHGELFPQATAEVQAALKEDPERVDLQVLLADIYLKSGSKERAAETSFRILEKLPNCLLANRIAADILLNESKSEEAETFFQRVKTMDPYASFLSSPLDNPSGVPAERIQLTKSEGRASFTPGPGIEQSDWAASLRSDLSGDAFFSGSDDILPPWLESIDDESEQSDGTSAADETPSIHPFAGAQQPAEVDIPGWMREAGWEESQGDSMDGPMHFSDQELDALEIGQIPADSKLEPADLPSWLKEAAPEDSVFPSSETDAVEIGSEIPQPVQDDPENQSDADRLLERVLPDEDFSDDEQAAPSIPSWLEDATPGATETIVTWLGDKSRETVRKQEEELPDWMSGTGPLNKDRVDGVMEESAQESRIPSLEAAPDDQPVYLQSEETSESEPAQETPAPPQPAAEDDLPDWLHSITDSPVEDEEADAEIEIPDWIHSMAEQAGEPPAEPSSERASSEEETGPEMAPDKSLPDWLTQSTDDLPETTIPDDEPGPDWLTEETPDSTPEPPASRETPGWISDLSPENQEQAYSTNQAEEPSDLDWLEELIEDAPASEHEGLDDSAPDWLSGVLNQQASLPVDDIESLDSEEIDWLQEFGKAQSDSEDFKQESGVDDWLSGMMPQAEEQSAQPPVGPADGPEQLDWLKEGMETPGGDASNISPDAPTLVSENHWKQDSDTLFEQPTIPSSTPDKRVDEPVQIDPPSDLKADAEIAEKQSGTTWDIFPTDETAAPVSVDDMPSPAPDFLENDSVEPSSIANLEDSEEDLSGQPEAGAAEQLLAEIVANNYRNSIPDALRATDDEIDLLSLLNEEGDANVLPEADPAVVPEPEEASGSAPLPSQPPAVELNTPPDWLTELADEEGFSDNRGVSSEELESLDQPLPADAFEEIFKHRTDPVEWIPEQQLSSEEPEAQFSEEPPAADAPLQESAPPASSITVSEAEFQEAIDWLDSDGSRAEDNISINIPESELSLPKFHDPYGAEEASLENTEDFFESLAAVEQIDQPPFTSASEERDQEKNGLDVHRDMPLHPDSSVTPEATPPSVISTSISLPESTEDKYVNLKQETAETLSNAPDVKESLQVTEAEAEELKEQALPPQLTIEYKKTGILSDRELPQEVTRGLEWLAELAAYHEMPVSGGPAGQAAAEKAAPEPGTEPSIEPEETEQEFVEIAEEIPGHDYEDVIPAPDDEFTELYPDEVPEPEWLSFMGTSTPIEEPEQPMAPAQEKPDGEIEPPARKTWKVTLTARKSAEAEEPVPDWLTASKKPSPAPQPEDKAAAVDDQVPTEESESAAAPQNIVEEPLVEVTHSQPAEEPLTEAASSVPEEEPLVEVTHSQPAEEPLTEAASSVPEDEPLVEDTRDQPSETLPGNVPDPDLSGTETGIPEVSAPAEPVLSPLELAGKTLHEGDLEHALQQYQELIKKRSDLHEIISELKSSIDQYPASPALWQTLGDAYMQNNQASKAIDAYQNGMDAS